MSPKPRFLFVALLSGAVFAACGKASEPSGEKVDETTTKSSPQSEGGNGKVKVNLPAGHSTIASTDAQGRTSVMEVGGAHVTEVELGLPIYPGATAQPNAASRAATPQGRMVSAVFESKDSVDKVAAFYRERLRAKAEGRQFMDNSSAHGVGLLLADPRTGHAVQVSVTKTEAGSGIAITSMQSAAK